MLTLLGPPSKSGVLNVEATLEHNPCAAITQDNSSLLQTFPHHYTEGEADLLEMSASDIIR